MTSPDIFEIIGYNLIEKHHMNEDFAFDLNSFCDSLDDGYGVFDDVADSLNFASVGISTANPNAPEQIIPEVNKNKSVKASPVAKTVQGRRGKKPGQKGICSVCRETGHNKRTCPTK